jgi:hypothetical protein
MRLERLLVQVSNFDSCFMHSFLLSSKTEKRDLEMLILSAKLLPAHDNPDARARVGLQVVVVAIVYSTLCCIIIADC